MRRLTAVLFSCVMATVSVAPVAAQETPPAPPWWFGDRAEMAEHGFALTVPGGWIGFDLTGDLEGQVHTVATELELADDAARGFLEALVEVRQHGTLLVLSSDDANCEFQVYSAEPGESQAFAWQLYEEAVGAEDVLSVDRPRPLTLPTGPALHMTWVNDSGNPELSMYLGQQQDLAYQIKCSGQSRPEDDWLSVAQAFEWLPEVGTSAPSPTPTPVALASPLPTPAPEPTAVPEQRAPPAPPWWFGDRAEMAEHGFALTVPDGWVGLDLTGDLEGQLDTLATALEMTDDVAQSFTEALLRVQGRGTLLVLTTDDGNCEFRVYAAEPGESEALAWQLYQEAAGDEDILSVDRPHPLTLPTGPALHLAWTKQDGNPELSMYLGQQDDLAYEIKCSGQSRPEDDWLSVAQAFEWLPEVGTSAPSPTPTPAALASPVPTPAPEPTAIPAGPPFPDRIEGTGVYDQAGVFGPFAVGVTDQVIRDIEEASGAQVVVYTQVKPESDTFEEAAADAEALMRQWGLGPDSLVILFDLEPGLCYGQIQLYASDGYVERHLSNAERQALFDEEIIPPLNECDFDTALLGAMARIAEAAGAGP